jgi:hypothetical protein
LLHGEYSIVFPAACDDSFRPDDRLEYLGTNMPLGVADSNLEPTNGGEISVRAATASAILFHHRKDDPQRKETTLVFDNDVRDAVIINSIGVNLDVPCITINTSSVEDGYLVKCLLIGTMEEKEWESGHQSDHFCTLLIESSCREGEAYKRIGVLDIRQDLGVFRGAQKESFKLV